VTVTDQHHPKWATEIDLVLGDIHLSSVGTNGVLIGVSHSPDQARAIAAELLRLADLADKERAA
jgi:hypothetical protein